MDSISKYKIKSRIWICGEEGTFLGEGRIHLLKKIQEHGSIAKAAKDLNMSYKKAWKLVQSMNALTNEPLVERTTGGKDGGGSILSEKGEKSIIEFEKLLIETERFMNDQAKHLKL